MTRTTTSRALALLLGAAALAAAAASAAGAGKPEHFHIEPPAEDALPGQPTGTVVDSRMVDDQVREHEVVGAEANGNLDEKMLQDNAKETARRRRGGDGKGDGKGDDAAAGNKDVDAAVAAQKKDTEERETAKEKRETLPAAAPMYDTAHGPARELACRECEKWFAEEPDPKAWVSLLPECPCTAAEAHASDQWHKMPHSQDMERYFPGASECVLSTPVHSHGQQCCFNGMGHLITSGFGAGTPHEFAHPTVMPTASAMHFLRDVVPFQQCCEQCVSHNCAKCRETYYTKRPSSSGQGCQATPSAMTMPFCEPREHVCFEHEGKLFVKSSGVCLDKSLGGGEGGGGAAGGGGGGGGKCAPHPNTPCTHDCVAAESNEVRLGCFCAREVQGSDVVCTETVPLLRAAE